MGKRLLEKRRRAFSTYELMVLVGCAAVGLFVSVVAALVSFGTTDSPLCATATLRTRIATMVAMSPAVSIHFMAEELHEPVARVLDSLPADQRVGVRGEDIASVWESLRTWPDPAVYIIKGEQHFEVHAPLPAIRWDSRGQMWLVGDRQDALAARFQRSEIGAIYALTGRGGHDRAPSVLFLDHFGEVMFEVSPGSKTEAAPTPAEFDATLELMKSLPSLCPR